MSTSTLLRPLAIKPGQLYAALLIMALALLAAEWLKPSRYWSDELGHPKYEEILPRSFGNWAEVPGASSVVVNPVQAEELARIYSETVSRTYVNRQTGRAVMLSIAYGRDQSTDTQLHTPEMCYASQGFKIKDRKVVQLDTPWGKMHVAQVNTLMGPRVEPLTYFVRTGDHVTTQGSLARNLARLGLALRGYKIDGLLVRVSEVTQEPDAFEFQRAFIVELLQALPQSELRKLIGTMAADKT